jgi:hypothetical protein
MLMDVHQRGDLAPTIAPRVVNRGLRYAPQSFTPVPGSTLHLGGAGKNRIGKDQPIEDGRITPDRISYCGCNVHATVKLGGALVGLFDRLHPVSRGRLGGYVSETRLFSPGGLARAYLTAAGFSPPAMPEDRLGPCAAASFGGWSEVVVRGWPPVVHVDFRRQHQTGFLLQGLQELLAAERLEFIDDTEAVKDFVKAFSPEDLYRPETSRKLNVLCWVKPAGAILPVRAAFKGAGRFSMAMAPRYGEEPSPFWLHEVIAAKLHDPAARTPDIERAERINPIGRQPCAKLASSVESNSIRTRISSSKSWSRRLSASSAARAHMPTSRPPSGKRLSAA